MQLLCFVETALLDYYFTVIWVMQSLHVYKLYVSMC